MDQENLEEKEKIVNDPLVSSEEEMDEAADLPKIESSEDLARIIQALVFASPEVVTLKKLREILGDFLDSRLVSDALIAANDSLNKIQSPFEIVEHAGGYRFRTRAKYYPWVRKLFPDIIIKYDDGSVDIYDVKYKRFDFTYGVSREDLFQINTYINSSVKSI